MLRFAVGLGLFELGDVAFEGFLDALFVEGEAFEGSGLFCDGGCFDDGGLDFRVTGLEELLGAIEVAEHDYVLAVGRDGLETPCLVDGLAGEEGFFFAYRGQRGQEVGEEEGVALAVFFGYEESLAGEAVTIRVETGLCFGFRGLGTRESSFDGLKVAHAPEVTLRRGGICAEIFHVVDFRGNKVGNSTGTNFHEGRAEEDGGGRREEFGRVDFAGRFRRTM